MSYVFPESQSAPRFANSETLKITPSTTTSAVLPSTCGHSPVKEKRMRKRGTLICDEENEPWLDEAELDSMTTRLRCYTNRGILSLMVCAGVLAVNLLVMAIRASRSSIPSITYWVLFALAILAWAAHLSFFILDSQNIDLLSGREAYLWHMKVYKFCASMIILWNLLLFVGLPVSVFRSSGFDISECMFDGLCVSIKASPEWVTIRESSSQRTQALQTTFRQASLSTSVQVLWWLYLVHAIWAVVNLALFLYGVRYRRSRWSPTTYVYFFKGLVASFVVGVVLSISALALESSAWLLASLFLGVCQGIPLFEFHRRLEARVGIRGMTAYHSRRCLLFGVLQMCLLLYQAGLAIDSLLISGANLTISSSPRGDLAQQSVMILFTCFLTVGLAVAIGLSLEIGVQLRSQERRLQNSTKIQSLERQVADITTGLGARDEQAAMAALGLPQASAPPPAAPSSPFPATAAEADV